MLPCKAQGANLRRAEFMAGRGKVPPLTVWFLTLGLVAGGMAVLFLLALAGVDIPSLID